MKTHIHFIITTFAFAILSSGANARMAKNAPIGENGSDSLQFLVDTGASSIVLNTNSLKLNGLIHYGETVSILGATDEKDYSSNDDNSIQIGSVRYEKVHMPRRSDCKIFDFKNNIQL